jgi:hypothetical protein
MSGINKLSIAGWILGIALSVTTSGFVYAGPVTNPDFASGDTLNAAHMNNIKGAVNDNDTKLNAIQAGTQTCAAAMTRVGSTCVDNARQAANQSWQAAVIFCRAANKRLLTPGEWVAAQNQGVLTDRVDDDLEWVDAVAFNTGAGNKMFAGYMGTTAALTSEIAFFDNQLYTAPFANIFFRCAR